MTILKSEQEMLDFGEQLGKSLKPPKVIELIGDVGAGKTTITRGIAKGLKIEEPVTSPSFTIAKRYAFPENGILAHYDFYRLPDPGIMSEDLYESINDEHTVTIIEWGNSVENLLPANHLKIEIKLREDGSREIIS